MNGKSLHYYSSVSCHSYGGDPKDHDVPYKGLWKAAKEVPALCGKCHVMKNYLESGHGKRFQARA